MEIGTINQIREKRDNIREKIKSLNLNDYSSTEYGSESEYTFKGIIAGIEELLTDISTLTKYPNKFIKLSTYNERNDIYSYLNRIEMHLESPSNYLNHFESLKTKIRSYNVRNISERQIEFENEIAEVRKIKLQLQQVLNETKEVEENISELYESIKSRQDDSNERFSEINTELESIIERKDELIEASEKLESTNDNLDSIKENASENLQEITDLLTESKSNEKLITSFANKIQDREKKLDNLEQNTNLNNEKLEEYKNERILILKEAEELIESAKKALNYKTAEGISASFQEQYDDSNNWRIFGSWIIGAIVSLIGTIALGIWILNTKDDSIGILLGRISLLPLPIIGAVFCANQYTKQKNIIEDYAYKMVLSKAIVGFSEQLKKNSSDDNEEYVHYIKTALGEIHKDPLRKRENLKRIKQDKSNDANLKDLVEVAERIIKMSKPE